MGTEDFSTVVITNLSILGNEGSRFQKERKSQKLVATISVKGKSIWLGYFDEYENAVIARENAESEYSEVIVSIPKIIKETKGMKVFNGVILQVSTTQIIKNGLYLLSESLNFIPNVEIYETVDKDGIVTGRRLTREQKA